MSHNSTNWGMPDSFLIRVTEFSGHKKKKKGSTENL